MAIRFAIERVDRNRALRRAQAMGLLLCTGTLFLLTSGCRSPWNAQSNQPSFDRLMEIENSSATMPPSFQSQVNNRRPGNTQPNATPSNNQYPIGMPSQMAQVGYPQPDSMDSQNARFAQKPAGGASRRISDMDEFAAAENDTASQEKQELLKKMQRALQADEAGDEDPKRLASGQDFKQKNASSRKKNAQPGANDRYAVHISDDDERQDLRSADGMLALRPVPNKEADRKPSSRKSNDDRRSTNVDDGYVANASHDNRGKDDSVRSALGESMAESEGQDSYRGEVELDDRTRKDLSWEQHVRLAIKKLESADKDALETPQSRIRQQVLTRMLAMTLDDRQAMLQPVDGLQLSEQEYFNYQFLALADAIDPEANPSASRKWSTVMINQRKALTSLASVSSLEINNLTFCTEVLDYGVLTPFATNKFKAGDEVLLYLELDNFVSEKVRDGKGYETQLQGSYEIVDSNGRRVVEQSLPSDAHVCKNMRRDYFIAYRIHVPDKISPGPYTLKLTMEDMKARKYGQKDIQFQIQ